MRDAAHRLSTPYLVLGWVSCLAPAVTGIACGAWGGGAQGSLVCSILWAVAAGYLLLRVFPKGRIRSCSPANFAGSEADDRHELVHMLLIGAVVLVFVWLDFAGR